MASSDPEIKDGLTLPVWMKSRPAKEFEPYAASPPAPEDSFFYIRYPKTDVIFGKPKLASDTSNLMNDQHKELAGQVAYNTFKEKDWSKHTKPCQDVLHGITPLNTTVNSQPKPAGTDDGYKDEGAACGNSVVKVAHKMIQSNRSPRGFTVASPAEEEAQAPDYRHYNLHARRGSKSLPVTPAHSPNSSPTSRRKMVGNRFFTSPFEPVEDSSHRSWLTMALLGLKKELTTSTSTLAEEDAVETRMYGGTLAESVENLGPSPKGKEPNVISTETSTQKSVLGKPPHAFRPKPSELREMNFWSPTSM
ncbi:unnamed protein product [Parnassius apollo]|uniref:(apollo) hypothetical protein n=1 Tax=Parnassius apollo TaxID=110799 RepID=A0A8S3XMC9_PARAO|nr:unnamed protein product [Parnassius apollo]